MGSDKGRVSYDSRRQYRGVVAQMGRVTVEADPNEASLIASEEQRIEARDFVGPSGTPDDGFKVLQGLALNAALPYDFKVTAGTMYVGGERAYVFPSHLEERDHQAFFWYSQQPDWIDGSDDPTYYSPQSPVPGGLKNEFIYLYLEEAEVSGVEDSALVDVALDGPDTGQRTRLLQRVKRLGTSQDKCLDATHEVAMGPWANDGLRFDEASMRLQSLTTLKVGFTDSGSTTPALCEPAAQGGYSGTDNQLIRVRVASFDAEARRVSLLWGYDNASALYRIDTQTGSPVVTLQQAPVDRHHWPRAGQSVEVLKLAAQLYTGTGSVTGDEMSAGDYLASPTGTLMAVASAFDPDNLKLTLDNPLLFATGSADLPFAFLRVWEEKIDNIQLASPVTLTGTGVTVTLDTLNTGANLHPGDYWLIGLRPGQPALVYPERIKDFPQAPDGPRRWACPLAVVNWTPNHDLNVVNDCRNKFDNLVDLTNRLPTAAGAWTKITSIGWPNDQPITMQAFNAGLQVFTSAAIDGASVNDNTFRVELDLVSGSGGSAAGASPFFHSAQQVRGVFSTLVGLGHTSFKFQPEPTVDDSEFTAWLTAQAALDQRIPPPHAPGIRCRVVLEGDDILDLKGGPLDADTFGVLKQAGARRYTDLQFDSGDGTKGGRLYSWFFLTKPATVTIQPTGSVPGPVNAITFTFSKPMDPTTLIPANITVTSPPTGAVLGRVRVTGASSAVFEPVDSSGNPIPFPGPPSGAAEVTYTVNIDGSKVLDDFGMQLDGTGAGVPGTPFTGQFKIAVVTKVQGITPVGNVAPDPVPPAVVVTFTNDIQFPVPSTAFLVTDAALKNVPGAISWTAANPNQLTFTPTSSFTFPAPKDPALAPSVFNVTLHGSQILDTNNQPIDGGGGIGTDFTSSFAIFSLTLVHRVIPLNGSNFYNGSGPTVVEVTFTQPMNGITIDSNSVKATQTSPLPTADQPGTVTNDSSTKITFTRAGGRFPGAGLVDFTYEVRLNGSLIKDANGGRLVGNEGNGGVGTDYVSYFNVNKHKIHKDDAPITPPGLATRRRTRRAAGGGTTTSGKTFIRGNERPDVGLQAPQ